MKNRKALSGAAATAAAAALLGATTAAAVFLSPVTSAHAGRQQSNVSTDQGLRATAWTDRSQYMPNRAVEIYLSLTNTGSTRRVILLNNRFEYDILIRDARTGRLVWQWSRNKRPSISRLTLEPGETRRNREMWDQRDSAGQRVAPGVYNIEARISPARPVMTQIYLGDRRGGGGGGGGGNDGNDGDEQNPQPSPQNPPPAFPLNPRRPTIPGPVPGTPLLTPLQSFVSAQPISVRPGQTARIRYMVKNRGQQPVTMRFSSGKQFDVIVRPLGASPERPGEPQGRLPWRYSADRMFTMALMEWTLTPGESRTFTAEWLVPAGAAPGAYEVSAFLTPASAPEGQVARASTRIQVVGAGGGPGPQ